MDQATLQRLYAESIAVKITGKTAFYDAVNQSYGNGFLGYMLKPHTDDQGITHIRAEVIIPIMSLHLRGLANYQIGDVARVTVSEEPYDKDGRRYIAVNILQ